MKRTPKHALIQPMEPVLIKEMPRHADLLYQLKWDGIRLLANVDHGNVELYTRNQKVRTFTYPEIVNELSILFANQRLVLDGECVVISKQQPDFYQLLKRDRTKDLNKIQQLMLEVPVTYIVFDLLYFKDRWLTHEPLIVRMKKLQSILVSTPGVQLCGTTEDGEQLLHYTKQKQWAGIVLKEKSGLYYAGQKHPTWQKINHVRQMEAFVIGVTMRARRVDSLILAMKRDNAWHFIGKTSKGLTSEAIDLITNWVTTVQTKQPAVIPVPVKQPIIWVPPYLKVTIEYKEWTYAATVKSSVIKSYSFQK